MTRLLFFSIAVFGLCYVVGHARVSLAAREALAWAGGSPERVRGMSGLALVVSAVFRFVLALIECPACLGFWLGFAGGVLLPGLVPFELRPGGVPGGIPATLASALALGLFQCGAGYTLGTITGWIKEN